MFRLTKSMLLLCIVALDASAQGAVEGVVIDERSKQPLACMDVALTDSSGRILERVQSSRAGAFAFVAPTGVAAFVRFSAHGLTPSPSSLDAFEVNAAGARQYQVVLEPLESGAQPEALRADDAQPGFLRSQNYPKYPDALRATGLTGSVVVGFMIDARGRPDTTTVIEMQSSAPEFLASVFTALTTLRFRPARRAGHDACVFSIQQYQFNLGRPGLSDLRDGGR